VVVVVGGGGGVEGNFSVSFGPKPGFRLWLWFWPKLNNMKSQQMKSLTCMYNNDNSGIFQ
jgi:hypothetical protein